MSGDLQLVRERHVQWQERPLNRLRLLLLPAGAMMIAPESTAVFDLPANGSGERLAVPRLVHEPAGAAAHGFDSGIDAAPACHDEDRQQGIVGVHFGQQLQSLRTGRRVACVVQIHQQQVVV
jgi:hypothetical protein